MNASLVLGAAAGLVMASAVLLPGGVSAPRWSLVARLVLLLLLLGLMIADAAGGYSMLRTPTYRAIVLAGMAAASLLLVLTAVRSWHDEDALAEAFGPQDGYVARPHRLSSRARAVVALVFAAGMLAATALLAGLLGGLEIA